MGRLAGNTLSRNENVINTSSRLTIVASTKSQRGSQYVGSPDAIPGERAPSDVDRRAGLAVPKGRAMMRTLTPITLQEVSFAFAETLFLTASRCISNPAASWRYWALPAAAKHAAASAGRAERAGQRRNPLWRQAGRPRRMGIAPGAARYRHGFSGLCPLAAYERGAERRLSAAHARRLPQRTRAPGQRGAGAGRPQRLCRT